MNRNFSEGRIIWDSKQKYQGHPPPNSYTGPVYRIATITVKKLKWIEVTLLLALAPSKWKLCLCSEKNGALPSQPLEKCSCLQNYSEMIQEKSINLIGRCRAVKNDGVIRPD